MPGAGVCVTSNGPAGAQFEPPKKFVEKSGTRGGQPTIVMVGGGQYRHGVSQPSGGGITTLFTTHEFVLPAQSVIVMVIGCEPGPTIVPAGGDWEQVAQQLSVKQLRNWHRLGTGTKQPVAARTSCASLFRHMQSMAGGCVSDVTVTVNMHDAVIP